MHKIWKECSINQELQNDKLEGSRLDLTDVQGAKITFCCVYVLAGVQPATDCVVVVFPPLPARCIMIILVYFFPKKVRRSVLPWLNSLSHSPGTEQTANSGKS